ncbi:MAG: RidA family protein [Bacteroidaceae bacterium]|nr:RidA family protein [Bacteroidaceae bacterium]
MKKVIVTNDAPSAIGPYSQAIDLNGTVFVSGQLPVNPADGTIPESIEEQTKQVLKNIEAILKAGGMSLNDVVKTTVLLADLNDFAAMNAAYAEFFKETKPARVCYQVVALPKGAKLEIDAIAGK